MAGMTKKEIYRLVEHVEPQGVRITNTKKGLLLRLPNGESSMLHWTTSDVRAADNLRATLRRAGVTWPTDHYANVPPYIADRKPNPKTLEDTRRILERMGNPESLTSQEFLIGAGWSKNRYGDVYTRLYALDWRPTDKFRRKARVWRRPVEQDPEPQFAPDNVTSIRPDPAAPAPAPEPETPATEWRAPLTEPAPREFIDSVDSWTINLEELDGTLSVDQLIATTKAAGLKLEFRVWR